MAGSIQVHILQDRNVPLVENKLTFTEELEFGKVSLH